MQTKEPTGLYLQSPRMNQLNILKEVAANPNVTQAELASRCALSVAMVNNYMKEFCGAGFLEYRRKTAKSVTYHLTPSGIRRLRILQSELTEEMIRMFIAGKEHIRARIASCTRGDFQFHRIVLFGSGHLAQLAFHALEHLGTSILGVCDDNPEMIGRDFCGREVLSPSQIRYMAPEAVLIADLSRAEEIYRSLVSLLDRGIDLIRLDACSNPKSKDNSEADPPVELMNDIDVAGAPLSLTPSGGKHA